MPKNNQNECVMPRMAWNFSQLDDDTTEIYIYDVIVDKQYTNYRTDEKEGVSPKSFNEEIKKVTTQNICVRINSRGGDVFAAEAIRTAIRETIQQGKTITCKIDGFCGSAAVGISAACEKTSIPSSAWFMIHDPYMFTFGWFDSSELKKCMNMLDKVKQGIVNAYAKKTGKDKQELNDLMTAETWYTGDEAVENGFCDELMFEDSDPESEENDNSPENAFFFDVSMYKNAPVSLLSRNIMNMSGLQNNKPKNKRGVNKMDFKTVEELTAAYPELTASIAETATAAERKRIQEIENIALPGFESLVNKAKFDVPQSAADVAVGIIAVQKKQGAAYLNDVQTDVNNMGADDIESSGNEGFIDDNDPYLAAIDSELPETHEGGNK